MATLPHLGTQHFNAVHNAISMTFTEDTESLNEGNIQDQNQDQDQDQDRMRALQRVGIRVGSHVEAGLRLGLGVVAVLELG